MLHACEQTHLNNWVARLQAALFDELKSSLSQDELARLRPFLGTDGLHTAHTLAKTAAHGGGGYRRRAIYGM